ncbi:MAG: acyl-CoA dehydrogenase family protein [Nocardiaceae bacterium]|nr:acyl-CoA dehydrogenase family protein [Nocardiaceae bacterium]
MTTLGSELRKALDGYWHAEREKARVDLNRPEFTPRYIADLGEARKAVLAQMQLLASEGYAAHGFTEAQGGDGQIGRAVVSIEFLAMSDLSLMVKAGVQWGLFGGAVANLGTAPHHEKYCRPLINLDLLGCFAMTETGHGSDVQHLETTATYDPATKEFVINSPTPSSRKDYIGGAAQHAKVAAVFAQLITGDESHGVHCFVVPIRDNKGKDLPGVTTSDCGYKGGLTGVDNGRIMFDNVRVPRENLLNRYGDVAEDGTYSSPIDSSNRRFFTMIGTLVRGRITVGGCAAAATRVALTIAGRYALTRRQFSRPDGGEVLLMDYLVHQRRLLPLMARAYAYGFAQNELVRKMQKVQTAENPDQQEQRELESQAAGLKVAQTAFATRAIQECREACGGAGYLTENRLVQLKDDTDVFTTFEGDNQILTQLVAKELLTGFAEEVRGMSPWEWAGFARETVSDVVKKYTAAEQILQMIRDRGRDVEEEGSFYDRGTQLYMFTEREEYLISTAARRMQAAMKRENDAFDAFNFVSDHIMNAARAHVDRTVFEAFIAGIDACSDEAAKEVLNELCDLYALSVFEENRAWYIEHRRMSTGRTKAIIRAFNERCRSLRPHVADIIDGLGVPDLLANSVITPAE